MSAERSAIRAFVAELLERKGESRPLPDGEPLLSSGLLDSVDVLEIVTFLESSYQVDFASLPFDPIAFDTIDSIVALVERACD